MTHVLEEKTINKIMIAEDDQSILFEIEGGESIVAKCDADCCSHTWIEHVELPVNGFPAKVQSLGHVELNSNLDTRDGELQFYGFKISTDKGDIIIDFRNESNGYYGGSLVWPDDYFYGGVFGSQAQSEVWKEINSDQ